MVFGARYSARPTFKAGSHLVKYCYNSSGNRNWERQVLYTISNSSDPDSPYRSSGVAFFCVQKSCI